MTKKRKSTISAQKTGDGFIGRLFAQTRLPAHVTEEQDWYLDTPDVRLTRVFTVVLILHVVAVGGILAFKMVEKASTPPVVTAGENAQSESGEVIAAAAVAAPAADAPAAQPAPAVATTGDSGTSLLMDHPSTGEYQEYCVGSGETLVSIAQKLGVSAAQIKEINKIDSTDNLYTGRWIRVPKTEDGAAVVATARPETPAPAPIADRGASAETPAAPAPAPAAPKATETPPAPSPAREVPAAAAPSSYQVQKGDTLFGIARKFGIKYQDLMAANGIEKAENLQAGQSLKVPQP